MNNCKPEKNEMTVGQATAPAGNELENKERRTVIRKLAVGSAAIAGCSLLPSKWTAPLMEFGSLPAHAQTSGDVELVDEVEPAEPPATDTTPPEDVETAPPVEQDQPVGTTVGTGVFSLVFTQTVQPCASCGIWFDSTTLVIEYTGGTFTASGGSMLVKKTLNSQGNFDADISSIPASATITSAILTMRLNVEEGISNDDYTSVLEAYDNSTGTIGELVRTITARDDIKGRGYSKANPDLPIDFTDYAKKMHG